ncbi:MAG: M14 family metallopeptidase [Patescibacteria group bacterium]
MKKTIIIIVGVIIIAVGIYFLTKPSPSVAPETENKGAPTSTQTETKDKTKTVLGTSVEKRDITAYHFGTGTKELLFVGGIHGGYEWNTVLVAYELMDYLTANPTIIPKDAKVTVIPVLNPDGLNKTVGTAGRFTPADVSSSKDTVVLGRFNANNVDLNRNFDCDWKPKGVWMEKTVSGGTSAFSEPESQAFKNYIEANNPAAVVVWYSSAGGVFSSSCDKSISSETKLLTSTYATASGYKAYDSFDFYETAGDMTNWLAKKEIPAISVLLTTHTDTEWTKNKAGIDAVLNMLRQ